MQLDSTISPPLRRRFPRDPTPRFKPSLTGQLDAIRGCPDEILPKKHLARSVWQIVQALDLTPLCERYSALGRRGHDPRRVLAVLIYASLIGVHHATKIGALSETDAAVRFLSGGHRLPDSTIRRLKGKFAPWMPQILEQTVKMAQERGLLQLEECAVDSVRVRAHASLSKVRTLAHSQKRLLELEKVDVDQLSDDDKEAHARRVAKHRDGVIACTQQNRASVVLTNPLAAMMKFPHAGGQPGHRVTTMASSSKQRIVIGVLIDADPTDYGKLSHATKEARRVLEQAGVPPTAFMRVTADAGYCDEEGLTFAKEQRQQGHTDILINDRGDTLKGKSVFPRSRFTILDDDNAVICPAGTRMSGPYQQKNNRVLWRGKGCPKCELRSQCTTTSHRHVTFNKAFDQVRAAMQARMQEVGAKQQYNQRCAVVEPVYASLEHDMGYRRCFTRKPEHIVADILLKLIAHNIKRIIRARRLTIFRAVFDSLLTPS